MKKLRLGDAQSLTPHLKDKKWQSPVSLAHSNLEACALICSAIGSQSLVPGPAASAPAGNWLGMQILKPHPEPGGSERLGVRSAICILTSLPGGFARRKTFRTLCSLIDSKFWKVADTQFLKIWFLERILLDLCQSIKLVFYCLNIQDFTLGILWVFYTLVHDNWSLRPRLSSQAGAWWVHTAPPCCPHVTHEWWPGLGSTWTDDYEKDKAQNHNAITQIRLADCEWENES